MYAIVRHHTSIGQTHGETDKTIPYSTDDARHALLMMHDKNIDSNSSLRQLLGVEENVI